MSEQKDWNNYDTDDEYTSEDERYDRERLERMKEHRRRYNEEPEYREKCLQEEKEIKRKEMKDDYMQRKRVIYFFQPYIIVHGQIFQWILLKIKSQMKRMKTHMERMKNIIKEKMQYYKKKSFVKIRSIKIFNDDETLIIVEKNIKKLYMYNCEE